MACLVSAIVIFFPGISVYMLSLFLYKFNFDIISGMLKSLFLIKTAAHLAKRETEPSPE